MSTWVNESLEELLTLAPGLARPSPVALRAPPFDADGAGCSFDDEDDYGTFTAETHDGIDEVDRLLDELDADALDLASRLEAVDALARGRSGAALRDLRDALERLLAGAPGIGGGLD